MSGTHICLGYLIWVPFLCIFLTKLGWEPGDKLGCPAVMRRPRPAALGPACKEAGARWW